jgi:uncharacterized membrane protein YuzA (DUF378 family)
MSLVDINERYSLHIDSISSYKLIYDICTWVQLRRTTLLIDLCDYDISQNDTPICLPLVAIFSINLLNVGYLNSVIASSIITRINGNTSPISRIFFYYFILSSITEIP